MKRTLWPVVAFVVFCALVCASVWLLTPSASHYRWLKDGESLFAALNTEVQAGDTLERVEGILGKGEPREDSERLRKVIRGFIAKGSRGYPDGLQDGDVFISYPTRGGLSVTLQFRDGRLINHTPGDFARFEDSDGRM